MAHAFGNLPSGVVKAPEKFTLNVPDQSVDEFQQLLKLSKIGPETWYNKQEDGQFGVSRKWLIDAKEAWLKFDWRKQEARINSVPNFKAKVEDADLGTVDVHFAALFSNKKDATPVIFMHGWPGSFLEFFPMIDLLVSKYNPDTLPYHVIVPSLPGYGLSAGSIPLEKETQQEAVARSLHQLMLDLGFGSGYAAQGGDVGSFMARIMSGYKECKAFHLNMLMPTPEDAAGGTDGLTPQELEQTGRMLKWRSTGMSYALEHGLRPATIGLVLSASPLALLAWIGEKYIEWVDSRYPLQLETILELVSLYWYTDTFPRSIYPYRPLAKAMSSEGGGTTIPTSKETPLGYSCFPAEIGLMPKAWAEKSFPNLTQYRTHEKGGHFAALEQPALLLQDVEDFLASLKAASKL
ncbi:epoxide hydrolase [Colletotrichum scovillei]|uniref:Epoxide hydrolase n=1 Tax=Colletotrichum scovillei TaxID=1209932 RepID=A0A9P7RHI3_9PEZI|nr:epoxide hydrolase [Colletotrichum scovillei]KAF4780025.1 epoxide hydrolase [Colletotrichum scovillei]KAG7057298.1 epoxide hydrolase [Colletotrichum scovillei]KAG7075895.1 epoxide hydrolase [Colletotrichum scovillei]KAG7083013.1 epoxide hydrolase [Colletotrichum scovillei]